MTALCYEPIDWRGESDSNRHLKASKACILPLDHPPSLLRKL